MLALSRKSGLIRQEEAEPALFAGNTLDTNSHNALNGPKLPPTRVSMNFGVSVDVGELPSSSLEGGTELFFLRFPSRRLTFGVSSFLAAAQDESAGQLGHDMDLSPEILDGPEEDGAIAFDLGKESSLDSLACGSRGLT